MIQMPNRVPPKVVLAMVSALMAAVIFIALWLATQAHSSSEANELFKTFNTLLFAGGIAIFSLLKLLK
jgi:hypothetical protein